MAYDQFDLSVDCRKAFASFAKGRYQVAYENTPFNPPADGSLYLKFDYLEGESINIGLSRKCRSLTGMIQIGVIFSPETGVDDARAVAKEVAEFFYDGRIIGQGFVFTGGEVRPPQKSDTGWLLPIRSTVRYDS